MANIRYLSMLSQQSEQVVRFYCGYFNMQEIGRK